MTRDLKTSLEELAEAEYADAPTSTIDIGKARADGRRRMTATWLAPLGGGVAVATACVLVVNALGGTSPAKQAVPVPTAPVQQEFTGTDPLNAIGTFGYLPDGYKTTFHDAGAPHGDTMRAEPKPGPLSFAQPETAGALTLTRSAFRPKFPAEERLTPTTVPGSPAAFVVSDPGQGSSPPTDLALAWQSASGSWFTLAGGSPTDDTGSVAVWTRVAASVSDQPQPVPLPFHVEGLPRGVTVLTASLSTPQAAGGYDLSAGVSYHTGGTAAEDAYFSISIILSAGLESAPSTSLGPAVGSPGDPSTPYRPASPVACKNSKGLRICVTDHPAAGRDALASVGGAEGLLNRITSLGTDPTRWTTHVVN